MSKVVGLKAILGPPRSLAILGGVGKGGLFSPSFRLAQNGHARLGGGAGGRGKGGAMTAMGWQDPHPGNAVGKRHKRKSYVRSMWKRLVQPCKLALIQQGLDKENPKGLSEW